MTFKVQHKKGKHHPNLSAILWSYYATLFRIPFSVVFPASAIEALRLVTDGDRYDWCKLMGRRNLQPKKWYGSLVAMEEQIWVYSLRDNGLVIGSYFRRKGKMIFPETPYLRLEAGEESPALSPDIYKSFFPIPPYYCGNDSNNNGMGGVAPADFHYFIRLHRKQKSRK